MTYILDTDILSLLGHGDSPEAPRIRRRIAELPPDEPVVTTVVNFEEQMRGWMAALGSTRTLASQVRIYERLLQHLGTFRRMTVLGLGENAAGIAQRLKGKVRIGSMDLKIAAIALDLGATVVTRNRVDFGKVPGLRVEDWTSDVER